MGTDGLTDQGPAPCAEHAGSLPVLRLPRVPSPAQGLPEGHAGTLSEQRGANASTVLHVPRKCGSENTVKPKS